MRMMHEMSLHEDNCFITLTYDDENLPEDSSLNKKHFQKFMKDLRNDNRGKKIRFFHCGEYGEQTFRPHYHAILFGHDFEDRRLFKTQNDINIYTSDRLTNLWSRGFSTVGDASFESAAYVARYVTKKINGKQIEQSKNLFGLSPYNRCDITTGEFYDVLPEYATMSRGGHCPNGGNLGGIGKRWFDKYKSDCYPSDFLVVRGKKVKPPRYYDSQLADEELEAIKEKRVSKAYEYKENNTRDRLRIRETIKMAQLTQLKRNLD